MKTKPITIGGIIASIGVGGTLIFSTATDCTIARDSLVEKLNKRSLSVIEVYAIRELNKEKCSLLSKDFLKEDKVKIDGLVTNEKTGQIWYSTDEYFNSLKQ